MIVDCTDATLTLGSHVSTFTIGSEAGRLMSKLFFSYSHKDEELRDALETHLTMLKRERLIETVHDRRIVPGEPLDDAIDAYLEGADVILCLLSPDFIASEYCYSREMQRALERHQKGEAKVIPVILRHCDWEHTPLKGLLGTPRDNKPVKAWADIDEALKDVASSIRRAVESHTSPRQETSAFEAREFNQFTTEDVASRPRSGNLNLPKTITDKDRDDFAENAFEFIAEYFANSVDELNKRNQGVEARFKQLDARRFIGSAYKDGKKVSAITVYLGSGWGGRGISYNNSDEGETNSSNGSFTLPSRGDRIGFEQPFSQRSEKGLIDREGVASEIWDAFLSPLRR